MSSIDFTMKLNKIGNEFYDKNKSFSGYAGFLEATMSDLFYDLDEEKKQYHFNRIKGKYREMIAEKLKLIENNA
jgi:hypothetical protein